MRRHFAVISFLAFLVLAFPDRTDGLIAGAFFATFALGSFVGWDLAAEHFKSRETRSNAKSTRVSQTSKGE